LAGPSSFDRAKPRFPCAEKLAAALERQGEVRSQSKQLRQCEALIVLVLCMPNLWSTVKRSLIHAELFAVPIVSLDTLMATKPLSLVIGVKNKNTAPDSDSLLGHPIQLIVDNRNIGSKSTFKTCHDAQYYGQPLKRGEESILGAVSRIKSV
jgi:hypothetical protein